MGNNILIAITAGLGGMLGWGFADFFAKKTIDKIGDLRTLFWQQLFGVLPLLGVFLVHPEVPKLHHFDPLFLLIFGIVEALTYLALYAGFSEGQVSLLSPIFASYSVVVVILSILILGEPLYFKRSLAILITFIGILLISTDVNDLESSFRKRALRLAGLPQVVTALLGFSFWLLFLDKFLDGKPWLPYLLIIRIVVALTLLVYAATKRVSLRIVDRTLWKFLVCIGVFDVAAFSFVSYGFSHSQYPSIIAVLSATFSLPTILLAYFFLGERINRTQIAAAFTILCGIVLIALN